MKSKLEIFQFFWQEQIKTHLTSTQKWIKWWEKNGQSSYLERCLQTGKIIAFLGGSSGKLGQRERQRVCLSVCVAYQCEPNSLPMLLVNPKNLGFFGKFGENPQGKLGRERDRERKCVCVLWKMEGKVWVQLTIGIWWSRSVCKFDKKFENRFNDKTDLTDLKIC